MIRKQNLVLFLALIALSLSTLSLVRSSTIERNTTEESPHAQALALVFQTQQDKIREVDRENWWFDTKGREWEVRRPFAPGQIDSTHMFVVKYKIDGKEMFSWTVDTRAKTVSPPHKGASD
jgi:hypothetical protein